jgi:hypothetical protein
MERLLQWLDELDDLAATALFVWHRAGPVWLSFGLVCAAALHIDLGRLGFELSALSLVRCALGCVLIWGVGGLVASAFERKIAVPA